MGVDRIIDAPILLEGPTCAGAPSPDCRRVDVRVGGFVLGPTRMVANYRRIEFFVGSPESFFFSDLLDYSVQLERTIQSDSCAIHIKLLKSIQKPLPEEYSINLQPKSYILDEPFWSLRAYSKSSHIQHQCAVGRREFFAFPSEEDTLFVEAFLDSQWVGTKLERPLEVREVNLPRLRIKDVNLSLEDSYLLFEFSTTERPSYCNLELFSQEYSATVYRIPPHRTYLKISKLSDRFFESTPSYRLTCFGEGGGYARVEGPPSGNTITRFGDDLHSNWNAYGLFLASELLHHIEVKHRVDIADRTGKAWR